MPGTALRERPPAEVFHSDLPPGRPLQHQIHAADKVLRARGMVLEREMRRIDPEFRATGLNAGQEAALARGEGGLPLLR